MSDIFREVDEDVRQEQITRFLKEYGKYIIAVVVGLIVIYGSYNYYQDRVRADREAASEQFEAALSEVVESDKNKALADLGAIAEAQGISGYGLLAHFRQADMVLEAGDVAGAVAIYDTVSGDASVDAYWRDLAAYFAAIALVQGDQREEGLARLDDIAVTESPLQYLALEMKAQYLYAAGNHEEARQIFADLVANAPADISVGTRAAQMLAIIGRSEQATNAGAGATPATKAE